MFLSSPTMASQADRVLDKELVAMDRESADVIGICRAVAVHVRINRDLVAFVLDDVADFKITATLIQPARLAAQERLGHEMRHRPFGRVDRRLTLDAQGLGERHGARAREDTLEGRGREARMNPLAFAGIFDKVVPHAKGPPQPSCATRRDGADA
jgi:hypothetical protein